MNDPIERQAAIDILYNFARCIVDTPNGDYQKAYQASRYRLETLPSAQPELTQNLHNACTDLISRRAAIDTVDEALTRVFVEHREIAEKMINKIPTAQAEPHYDEWCTDCKEYDHERRCCPRWNRVIRETLKDAQPEIIRCKDCEYGDQDEVGRWFCTSLGCQIGDDDGSGFCADAERRTE